MNIKNGQKFGPKLLISRVFLFFKKHILLLILIFTFSAWVVSNILTPHDYGNSYANEGKILINKSELSGIAKVIDGDSIIIADKHEVRLVDIDAPEYSQKCLDNNKKEYFCGKTSTAFLKKLVEGKNISCTYFKKDMYDRFLGKCYLDGLYINAYLVENGMAIIYSFNDLDQILVDLEDEAKVKKVGMWQGMFMEPKKHRRLKK